MTSTTITVAEIKSTLRIYEVKFSSKAKKAELLDLLISSLQSLEPDALVADLPVDDVEREFTDEYFLIFPTNTGIDHTPALPPTVATETPKSNETADAIVSFVFGASAQVEQRIITALEWFVPFIWALIEYTAETIWAHRQEIKTACLRTVSYTLAAIYLSAKWLKAFTIKHRDILLDTDLAI